MAPALTLDLDLSTFDSVMEITRIYIHNLFFEISKKKKKAYMVIVLLSIAESINHNHEIAIEMKVKIHLLITKRTFFIYNLYTINILSYLLYFDKENKLKNTQN